MADLKTNYKDDVLDTSKNEKRKFRMIQNDDGTVSFDDATEYTQQGDAFGAADINATNAKINEQSQSLTDLKSLKIDYGKASMLSGEAIIEFKKDFNKLPSISIIAVADGTALFATIHNITQKSCTVIFWNGGNRYYDSGDFYWIAVGE